jgi:cell division septum initiation protein DivIVA
MRQDRPMSDPQSHVGLEAKLAQLEEMLAEAKPVPLSSSIMLNRAEIDGLVGEIRTAVPEEVKQARWVTKERADVLAKARADADALIEQAREERERLVASTEVVAAARKEADRIRAEAREDARRLRLEADDYVDAQLAKFEILLQKTLATIERGRENLRGRLGADALAEAVIDDD